MVRSPVVGPVRPARQSDHAAPSWEEVLMSPVCVEDYRRLARDKLAADVWDYIEGGSGARAHARRQPWRRSTGSGCGRGSWSTSPGARPPRTLLGAPLRRRRSAWRRPAYHQLAHADGEVGTAYGAGPDRGAVRGEHVRQPYARGHRGGGHRPAVVAALLAAPPRRAWRELVRPGRRGGLPAPWCSPSTRRGSADGCATCATGSRVDAEVQAVNLTRR